MREVFSYTFTTVAEWKKFLLVVLIVSIFTLFEPYPFIGITLILLEKLLYLSVGAFLIYLVKNSKTIDSYFENLQKNGFATFLFHFLPTAIGILLAGIVIVVFWLVFILLILKYTNSLFILADPHMMLQALARANIAAKILIGFYLIYLSFYSYIVLGKLGEALQSEGFLKAFVSMISSLYDFKFWVKTFNLKYFFIYLVWSIIISVFYSALSFTYIFIINPEIIHNPNISLIIIPVLMAFTTILTYYTFFSAYFSYKTTGN